MTTLRERLQALLPGVLPKDPGSAINGTALYEKIKSLHDSDYAEASVRQHFSIMAADATSPIAKREHGHGYYLRPAPVAVLPDTTPPQLSSEAAHAPNGTLAPIAEQGRQHQPEEKFRALYMRHARLENRFPMHIEHTQGAKQAAGVNKWKFPDVVLIEWDAGEANDVGYSLNHAILEVKRSLGEQPFRFTSVELKVELSLANFREYFFQCVSNSRWAHSAQLAIAASVNDTVLANELRRLGSSYGIAVTTYNFELGALAKLPDSNKIAAMSDAEFEALVQKLEVTTIASGQSRETLDWEHIRDMVAQSGQFDDLLKWVSRCLQDKKAYSFDAYQRLRHIETSAA